MPSSLQLRTERAVLVDRARRILDRARRDNRDLSAAENQKFDRIMTDVDTLKSQIDQTEMDDLRRRMLTERREETSLVGRRASKRAAWRDWMRSGNLGSELRNEVSATAEFRDTQIGADAQGGYLVAPVEISLEIARLVDSLLFIRRLATVRPANRGKSLRVRKIATRMADADWTTEVALVTEDTTMALAGVDLTPQLISKLAKVSGRLINGFNDSELIVNQELSYKFAQTEEKAFLTGDGNGKPFGVFVADAASIPTTRDIQAASSTAIAGDDLIECKFAIKQSYLNSSSAAWVLHRDVLKQVRKIKMTSSGGTAGDQAYIWSPGLTEGAPDKILDVPYFLSEYAPNTMTAGKYVAVLGDWRYFWIAETIDVLIQRLVELFAATSEVGFLARRWVNGGVVLDEAFARLQLQP